MYLHFYIILIKILKATNANIFKQNWVVKVSNKLNTLLTKVITKLPLKDT